MSSLFNQASLVVEPAVYENAKVYATKPFDGTGDLTFSRASSATRVQSDGLIEKVRTNLSTYSEDFANAAWSPNDVTVTSNTQLAPNGTTTADVVMEGTGTAQHRFQKTLSLSSSFYTFSVYTKNISGTRQAYIDLGPYGAYFTFSTETIYTPTGFASVQNVGSGWYRITLSNLTAISIGSIYLGLATGNSETYTGNGTSSIAFWGAQFETGDIATDYIATTTAAVSVGPVSGLPRLDYLGSTCPRLLLEPQRTNLVGFSEQMDNGAWTKQAGTVVTANATISPDGYQNADLVVGTGNGIFQSDKTVPTTTPNTKSVYLKGVSGGEVVILQDPTQTVSNTICNLTTNWQRFTLTETQSGGLGGLWVSGIPAGGIYIYGCQLEAGAYATSYIPTLGASVTRVADAATTASVPSLIGQTEGTMFIEFNRTNTFEAAFFMLSNLVGTTANAYQNSFYFLQQANGTMVVEVYVSAVPQVLLTVAALSVGTHKMALAYKANDFALYVDGVQLGTDTSGSVPTANFFSIGGAVDGGAQKQSVNQALLFKTRLTNAQLAELTA